MRVVFDLDGTLVDSSADLLAAINHVLRAHHLADSDRSENLRYAGLGIEAMFKATLEARVSGWSEAQKGFLIDAMKAHYSADPVALTRPYEGIVEMLGALAAEGVGLCVISNKPSPLSRRILASLFPAISFMEVLGPDSGFLPKPDPASLRSCRRGMGGGEALLYLGDTEVDHQTGEGTADYVFLASWGYRGRDVLLAMGFDGDIILEKPMELVSIVRTIGETV